MAFTQLNLDAKKNDPVESAQSPAALCRPQTVLVCGLVMATVFVALIGLSMQGCSSESKPAQRAAQPSAGPATPPPASAVPPVAVTPAVAPASKPHARKKVVRKVPATLVYSDPDHAVSFRYPKAYILKTGDEPHLDLAGMGPGSMNFVQPGGSTLAAVELPRDAYPGADVSSAFFMVSVNPNVDPAGCTQFARPASAPSDQDPVLPADRKIGDLEYKVAEDIDEASDLRYYHVFRNGECYEFALGLGVEPHGAVSPVNSDDVFWRLEKILASVKIDTGMTPQVASAPAIAQHPDPR